MSTTVRDQVRLHPSITGELARYRRPRTTPVQKNSAVTTTQVDPRVWQTAMRLANGDATRIVQRRWESVLVVNHSRRKVQP